MSLFIKGFIIGIAKIIPGVSGALLAINFGIYERLIEAVTSFFDNWKENLRFLLLFGLGVFVSIILCSNVILYLLKNYFFVTMMLFLGLIIGGTYNFSLSIKYNFKNFIVVLLVFIIFLLISFGNVSSSYILRNNFLDNVVFFIGGIIEIFSSIFPGISGTALQMILGIYDNVLVLMSSVFNFSYVFSNINLYISYGFGMVVSFIFNSFLISYLFKCHREFTNSMILGLCLSSILMLGMMTFSNSFNLINFIIGVMLFFIGLICSFILDK